MTEVNRLSCFAKSILALVANNLVLQSIFNSFSCRFLLWAVAIFIINYNIFVLTHNLFKMYIHYSFNFLKVRPWSSFLIFEICVRLFVGQPNKVIPSNTDLL